MQIDPTSEPHQPPVPDRSPPNPDPIPIDPRTPPSADMVMGGPFGPAGIDFPFAFDIIYRQYILFLINNTIKCLKVII